MPCHDQGRFVGEAIESVLQQTYQPVEVIVVNDGSSDDTAARVRSYTAVTAIDQDHRGAAAARNAGLRTCRGEFVIFLDADDKLLPHAVQMGVDALRAHPDWAFVTGHVRLVSEDGSPRVVSPEDHAEAVGYLQLLRANYIWTPGVVTYRRSVLDRIGGFNPSARGSADFELNIRIARQFAVGCHHQVVLDYRQHSDSMSGDAAFMLMSAVTARRAQRKHVRNDPVAMQALADGVRIVQADFGARLIEQVKRDARVPGRRRRAVSGIWRLLRYYPAGVVTIVGAAVRRLTRNPPRIDRDPARRSQ